MPSGEITSPIVTDQNGAIVLPSLRGLQALSMLSQTGSLTDAANILGLTRSALSHRIADLEHQLGVALIRKVGRRVVPTDDADALLSVIGDAINRIEAAVEPIRRRRSQLRISTVATFASHWLLPRLSEFRARHPDIEVALATTRRAIDLEAEDFDCAIRHGRGNWPGLTATLLFRETLAPVAAPGTDQNLEGSSIIRARSRLKELVALVVGIAAGRQAKRSWSGCRFTGPGARGRSCRWWHRDDRYGLRRRPSYRGKAATSWGPSHPGRSLLLGPTLRLPQRSSPLRVRELDPHCCGRAGVDHPLLFCGRR
jgi:DNA-binding transcriptional LysR family regulator